MVFKTPEHGHFCQIVPILYYSAGKFLVEEEEKTGRACQRCDKLTKTQNLGVCDRFLKTLD